MNIDWVFEPVQTEVVVSAAETAIMFYKIYNRTNEPIVGFSVYNVFPEEASTYFSKIQCFCFNQQLINPGEEILLPLFFYLEPEINEDKNVNRISEIKVDYRLELGYTGFSSPTGRTWPYTPKVSSRGWRTTRKPCMR